MSLIAISVDNSDANAGSKGGDWSLIIIVNNSINKITSEGTRNFPNYIIQEGLFMLISFKGSGCLDSEFQKVISKGPEVLRS